MNFENMPELGWTWGYPGVLLFMAVVTPGMLWYFRRKHRVAGVASGGRGSSPMSRWMRCAFSGPVVRRGLKCAVVVGILLVGINHGDAILGGSVTVGQWVRMGLTMVVPYCVSVFSSVGAMRDADIVGPQHAARGDLP